MLEAGLRDPRENSGARIFGGANNPAGVGAGFFAEKKSRPDPEARQGARADFFSQPGHAGSGLDFLFRGPGRGWFFFAGRPAWGRGWIFFFGTGLDFSCSGWEVIRER